MHTRGVKGVGINKSPTSFGGWGWGTDRKKGVANTGRHFTKYVGCI